MNVPPLRRKSVTEKSGKVAPTWLQVPPRRSNTALPLPVMAALALIVPLVSMARVPLLQLMGLASTTSPAVLPAVAMVRLSTRS